MSLTLSLSDLASTVDNHNPIIPSILTALLDRGRQLYHGLVFVVVVVAVSPNLTQIGTPMVGIV